MRSECVTSLAKQYLWYFFLLFLVSLIIRATETDAVGNAERAVKLSDVTSCFAIPFISSLTFDGDPLGTFNFIGTEHFADVNF